LALEVGLRAPQGAEKIRLKITFYPPDKRHRDADNMVAAIKSGLDGLADALRVNDRLFLPTFIFSDEPKGYVEVIINP
jgi:crossover junction endodeoxyribonuclease RusA